MDTILEARERIYNHLEDWETCHWSDIATNEQFVTYCVAKDTIQDTAEAIMTHRSKGFSSDTFERYIEYYGLLQAVYMQQDAIYLLYGLLLKKKMEFTNMSSWDSLRKLRNETVGHPVGSKRFLNRSKISYDNVSYSWWPESKAKLKTVEMELGKIFDEYSVEASSVLNEIADHLDAVCKSEHQLKQ